MTDIVPLLEQRPRTMREERRLAEADRGLRQGVVRTALEGRPGAANCPAGDALADEALRALR